MKALKIILCVILAAVLAAAVVELFYLPRYLLKRETFDIRESRNDSRVTVVSANVRCYSPTDFFKRSWFYRAPLLVVSVAANAPDVIGFQEVTPMHYKYLTKTLLGYDSVIEYRDRSPLREGCPIFFNTEKFDLVDKGSFWLSETPGEMSKDWGAAHYRICSFAVLTQKSDGKEFAVFNTHLDHVSDEARINGIHVVLDKMKEYGDLPCVLMGDLNADESSSTYAAATEVFDDAKYKAEKTDSGATYHNWGQALDRENIDYFMVTKDDFDVDEYAVIRPAEGEAYPSDHFQIMLRFRLK